MAMHLSIAAVTSRTRPGAFAPALEFFAARLAAYNKVDFPDYDSEQALLESVSRHRARTAPMLVLLDSRGRTFTSEAFAAWLERERDEGRQSILFAIGPASGWSAAAHTKAGLLLSLGPMTLPHELARVVLAEQVYRAFTIMAGHPYHLGH